MGARSTRARRVSVIRCNLCRLLEVNANALIPLWQTRSDVGAFKWENNGSVARTSGYSKNGYAFLCEKRWLSGLLGILGTNLVRVV